MIAPPIDKHVLLHQICEEIERERAILVKAANEAREAATHEEARPENDKDTRGLEASYLARGQAARVYELERDKAALVNLCIHDFSPGERIFASALIELDAGGKRLLYFLAPQGGGIQITTDAGKVMVITPQSPLGRELLGKCEGDTVEVITPKERREYDIRRVL